MACGSGLELVLLNEQLGNIGILTASGLRFYTRVLLYEVTFGSSGSYMTEKFNRFLGYWEGVIFSGTLGETVNTINLFGPFLTLDEVNELWADVTIPPEDVNAGFILNPI